MALKFNVGKRLEQRKNEIIQQKKIQDYISSEEENSKIAKEEQMIVEDSGETYDLSDKIKSKIGDYTVYDEHPMDTDEIIEKSDTTNYEEYVRSRQAKATNYYGDSENERDYGSDIVKRFKTEGENTSRYRNSYRILNKDDEQYVATYDGKVIPKSPDDSYHIVTIKDENRLDLISFHYYKTPLLWWLIAEASDIIDPFNVPVNSVLRIPSMSNIYSYGGILST